MKSSVRIKSLGLLSKNTYVWIKFLSSMFVTTLVFKPGSGEAMKAIIDFSVNVICVSGKNLRILRKATFCLAEEIEQEISVVVGGDLT
jgi:hypothetical protein